MPCCTLRDESSLPDLKHDQNSKRHDAYLHYAEEDHCLSAVEFYAGVPFYHDGLSINFSPIVLPAQSAKYVHFDRDANHCKASWTEP